MFPIGQKLILLETEERVVVLGDPHGDIDGVAAILEKERGASRVVCVGDVVGYEDGPRSSSLCSMLKSLGIPTVLGNHEEWASSSGKLAFMAARNADNTLRPDAWEWISSLPHRLDILSSEDARLILTLVHSCRLPTWEIVGPNNAKALHELLDEPPVLAVGHSHCPRFIEFPPASRPRETVFDFRFADSLTLPALRGRPVIVDAGSVSRPRASLHGREQPGFGTYAILDLVRHEVSLRRIAT